jgi:hypothetical protein
MKRPVFKGKEADIEEMFSYLRVHSFDIAPIGNYKSIEYENTNVSLYSLIYSPDSVAMEILIYPSKKGNGRDAFVSLIGKDDSVSRIDEIILSFDKTRKI